MDRNSHFQMQILELGKGYLTLFLTLDRGFKIWSDSDSEGTKGRLGSLHVKSSKVPTWRSMLSDGSQRQTYRPS